MAAGMLVAAAPGRAATVSVGTTATSEDTNAGVVDFVAGAGEANRLTSTLVGVAVRVADPGAPLTPGAGCSAVDAHTALCAGTAATGAPEELDARLGDGDDSATVALPGLVAVTVEGGDGADAIDLSGSPGLTGPESGFATMLGGGPGDDHIVGSPGNDQLDGDPGDDVIDGGAGSDGIDGGPGADTLMGGEGGDVMSGDASSTVAGGLPAGDGDDVIDGGPGANTLSYADHAAGLRIDLESGLATSAGGERDRISGFHSVVGGRGGDVIRGTAQADQLQGSFDNVAADGADVLIGRGGNDQLVAGGRGSRLFGGPGNDLLDVDDTAPLALFCGSGRDTVSTTFAASLVRRSCERVATTHYVIALARVGRRRVSFRDRGLGGWSPATLTLGPRHGHRRYGRVRWGGRGHHRRRLVVRLNAAGRRAVRHRAVIVARVRIPDFGPEAWRFRL